MIEVLIYSLKEDDTFLVDLNIYHNYINEISSAVLLYFKNKVLNIKTLTIFYNHFKKFSTT